MEYRKTNHKELKERSRVRRENNPQYYRDRAREYRERGQQIIRAAKAKPCADCDVQLPAELMELDHVRGTKRFNLCQWQKLSPDPGKSRIDMVIEEIPKCDVRCPNCHRLRHWNERTKLDDN